MAEQIDKYVLDKFLGNGAYGDVYLALDIDLQIYVAIKRVEKIKLQDDGGYADQLLQQEISILQSINSPNVVRLIEALEGEFEYFLIFEYCNGGDLWGLWEKNKYRFPESDAVAYMRQIINGLKDLHQLNVIHRDLKLPNILINDHQLKIGDLGFAKFLNTKEEKLFDSMGTLGNMAPEVMEFKPYGLAADMFSLGTMFYQMLYTDYPFKSDTFESFIIDVKKDSPKLDKPGVVVSAEAKDLLKKMLKYNPDDRILWEDLYVHPIFYDQPDSSFEIMNMSQLIAQQVDLQSNRKAYLDNKSKFQNLQHTTQFDFLNSLLQQSKLKKLPKISESLQKKMQAMSKVTQQLFQQKQNADQLRHNPQIVKHRIRQVLEKYINKFNMIKKLKEIIVKVPLSTELLEGLQQVLSNRQDELFTSVSTGQNIFGFEFFEFLIQDQEYLTFQRIVQQQGNSKATMLVQSSYSKNLAQTSINDILNLQPSLFENQLIVELINLEADEQISTQTRKI